MTTVEKIIIGVMSVLTLLVFIGVGALAVMRLNEPPPAETPTTAAVAPTAPAPSPTSLATAARGPSPTLAPTATPVPTVVVRSAERTGVQCSNWAVPQWFGSFVDPAGIAHFVGEGKNTSGQARSGASAVIQLFNAQSQYVGLTTAPLLLDTVPPGKTSPYNAVLPKDFPAWQSYSVTFDCAPPNAKQDKPYTDLEIVSQTVMTGKTAPYAVAGTIRNSGEGAAKTVQVIGVLYDENGWVINAVRVNAQPEDLNRGQEATFEIDFDTLVRPVAKYTILYQAHAVP
jgi:hypothetical protein